MFKSSVSAECIAAVRSHARPDLFADGDVHLALQVLQLGDGHRLEGHGAGFFPILVCVAFPKPAYIVTAFTRKGQKLRTALLLDRRYGYVRKH
jgi:hypothetical protein